MKILNRFTPSNTKTQIIKKHMKKLIAFTAILSLLVSCSSSSDKGELIGVKGKKWHPEKPFGTVLIPGGALWLPLVLKLIPDLLPSAFKENEVEEKK